MANLACRARSGLEFILARTLGLDDAHLSREIRDGNYTACGKTFDTVSGPG